MDLGDFFRTFLGLGDRQRRDFPRTEDDDDGECEGEGEGVFSADHDNEFQFFFGNGGRSMDDMFRHFHGDMHRQMESLHQQMEDMLRGFGTIASERLPPENRPTIVDTPKSQPNDKGDSPFFFRPVQPYPRSDKKGPRDFMLKDNEDLQTPRSLPSPPAPPSDEGSRSFGMPFRRLFPRNQPIQDQRTEDTDLDGKFSSSDAVDLIKKSNDEKLPQRSPYQRFSSGSLVTVTTVRGLDGKTEHKKVVRDSSGREESTVSRSVDGQCHTITTIKGPDGLEERREDFKNMDENDIQKFIEKWHSKQTPKTPSNPPILGPSNMLDARDRDLFSKFFESPPKK